MHLLDFGACASSGAADAVHAAAKTHGYAAGYAAGMRAATEAARAQRERLQAQAQVSAAESAAVLGRAVTALETAARAFEQRVAPVVETVETTLVAAGLELAETIVGTELLDGEHSAQAALSRVLTELDPAQVRRVRMHPGSVALLPEGVAERAGVKIVPDAQLNPGDALADLPEGFLDARIATAMRRCHEALAAHQVAHAQEGRLR